MTIKNDCSFCLELVHWIDYNNNVYYFTNGEVWDNAMGEYVSTLRGGTSVTKDVKPGNSYIYFYLVNDFTEYSTTEMFSMRKGQKKTVSLYCNSYSSHLGQTEELDRFEIVIREKNTDATGLQEKKNEIARFLESNY